MNNMERNTETLSDIMAEEEPDVVKPAADLLQTVGGSHPDCLMDAQTQNTGCRRDAVRDDHGNAAAESQSVNDKVGVTTSNTTPPIVESEEEKTLFHSVLRQMQQQQKLKPGRRCKKKTLMKMAKLFVIAKEWDSKITETIGMKYSNGPLSEHELQVLNQGEETFTSSVTSQNNTIKTKSLDVGSSDCNRETFIPATSADATFSGQTAEPQVTLKKKSKAKQDCCASTNLLDVPDLNPEISECSRLITSTKVQKKSRNMSSVAFKEDPKITCDNSETARNSLAVISSVDVSETQTSNPTSSVKRRTKQKNLPRTLTEYNAMMPQDGSEGFLLSDVTQKDENEAMCTTAAEIHSEDPPGTQAKNKTGRKKVKMSKAKQFVQDAETTGDNKKSDSCKVEDLSDQQTSPSQVSYIKSSQVSKWRRTRVVKKEPVVKNGNMLDEVLHVQDSDTNPLNENTHDVKITGNQEEMLNVLNEEQLISDRIEAANPENTKQFKGKKKHLVGRRRPKVSALVQENVNLAGEVQNGLTSPSPHENVPEIIKAKRKRDHSGDQAAVLSEDESQMEEVVSDLKNALTVSFEFDCEAPKSDSTWRENIKNKVTTKRKSGQTAKKKALMRLSNQKSSKQQPESDKGVFMNQELCNKPKLSPAGSDKASKAVNMEDAVLSINHTANTDLNSVKQEQDESRISELTSEVESPCQDKISPTESARNTKMETISKRQRNKTVCYPKKKLKRHQICASFESSVSPSFHQCNSLTNDEMIDLKLKDDDVTQRSDEAEEMTANTEVRHSSELIDNDPLPQKLKPQKPLKCSFCGRSFRHISAFTLHKRIHTGEKPYRCTTCGKRFAHVSRLKLHSETHKESPAVCCPCCDQKFKSKDELIVHFLIHVKDIKSSNVTEDSKNDAPVTLGQNKPFKCSVCCKEFISRATFKMHGRTHSGKQHSCSVCGKTFHKSSSLTVHEKTHWPVKPYSCSVCCAGFIKLWELKCHSETHSGVKPFSCTRCEKDFGSFALLRSHQTSAVCSEKRDFAEGNQTDIEGFLVSQEVEGQITNCETCGEEYEAASDIKSHCSVCCRASGEDRMCRSSLSEIWKESEAPQSQGSEPPHEDQRGQTCVSPQLETGEEMAYISSLSEIWKKPEAPENQAREPSHEDQTSQMSFSSQVETEEEKVCKSSLSKIWKDKEASQSQESEPHHEDQKIQTSFSPEIISEEERVCRSSLTDIWKEPEAPQNQESEPSHEDPKVQKSISPQLETGEDRTCGSSLSEILKELEAPENQPSEPSLSEIRKETENPQNLESEAPYEHLNSPQLETGEDSACVFTLSENWKELESLQNQANEDQKGQTSFPSQVETEEAEACTSSLSKIFKELKAPENQVNEPSHEDQTSQMSISSQVETGENEITDMQPPPSPSKSNPSVSDNFDISVPSLNPSGEFSGAGNNQTTRRPSRFHQRSLIRRNCGRHSYNRWNKLQLHQRSHRQTVRPFCCSQCDLEFRFLGSYMDHLREHAARTPYTCPLCPDTFSSDVNMSAHIFERHKQDDGMKCSTCGKSFSSLRHLKRHKMLHKGVNSHLRLPCNVSFSRIRALKTHLKTHRTRLNVPQPRGLVEPFLFPYHCWKCPAAFSSTDLLQAHQVCHFTPGEKMDDPPEDTQQGDERPTRRLPVSNKKHLFRYPHPDRLYVVPVVSLETPVVISDTEEEQSPSITAKDTTPAPNTSNIPQTSSVPALREHETHSSHQQLQDQYEEALKDLTDGCNSADLEPVYMIHMDKDEFIDDAHICAICNETFTDISKLHEHYVDHAKLTFKV